MNYRKLLVSYKLKLILESALKALLAAGFAGGGAVFVASLIYHIRIAEAPAGVLIAIGGGISALTFAIFFVLRFPSSKKVAKRLDQTGLYERVSTMLELRNETTEIAGMQRKDALYRLKKTSPKQMKLRMKLREYIMCGVALVLAGAMVLLPYNLFEFNVSADSVSEDQAKAVRELIEKLRQDVKDADIADELKDKLNEIVDELEDNISEDDSELQKAAKIEQAKNKMEQVLEEALSRYKIGEALQNYELTIKLGEAISKGNTELLSSAMAELSVTVKADKSKISELAQDISAALADSGIEDTDELYDSLADFATEVSSIMPESDYADEQIDEAFSTALERITQAIENQKKIEEAIEKLGEDMEDAEDEILGNEKEETEDGEKPDGESPEGEMPEGEKPEGEMPEGDMPEGDMPEGDVPGGEMPEGEGDGEGQGSGMTEGIYDPIAGNVSYGEVYAAYHPASSVPDFVRV